MSTDQAGTTTRSQTEELLARARRSRWFRENVAMESTTGWPVPVTRSSGWEATCFLTVPLFGTRSRDGGGLDVLAPHASFTVQWPSGRLVAFSDHRFANPAPDLDPGEVVGAFPHDGLPATTGEYLRLRSAGMSAYDGLLAVLTSGAPAGEAEWQRFVGAVGPLVEPGLAPFYRAVDPGFAARVIG